VVVAKTGAAMTKADNRNARLARDKSILDTSKKKVPGRCSEFYLTSIECANKKEMAPEESDRSQKRKFTVCDEGPMVHVYFQLMAESVTPVRGKALLATLPPV